MEILAPHHTPVLHVDCHGEGLRLAKDRLGEKNIYYMNPSFDK